MHQHHPSRPAPTGQKRPHRAALIWLLHLGCRITIGICAELLAATTPPAPAPDCWMCEEEERQA